MDGPADFALAQLVDGLGDPQQAVRALLRVLVALCCGACIGYQREQVGKAAGLRTHIIVAGGAAVAVAAAFESGMEDDALSRVIQGLLTGVGFLGAGAILKLREVPDVRGLTTAAGIWMTCAIGVAAGLGRFAIAILATAATWYVLNSLQAWERRNGEEEADRAP
ncbi:MgtC/SapB family protein [Methyloversatilis sp. MC4-4]|uniref:MgtC/SapB family protein n=1 Tax=Methyloversatilis sp. MC4-4 TaxID=3132824 RepID=UPI003CEA6163